MFRHLCTAGLGISGRQSEIIELALSYGFKGIDLDLIDLHVQVTQLGLPMARRLIDSARLKIGTFRLPVVWDEDDGTYQSDLVRLAELAKLAAEVGATRAIATVQPASDRQPYHQNFTLHQARLTEIGNVLLPFGIQLGLEFVATSAARRGRAFEFIHSLDALVMLTTMIQAKNVGVVIDLWQIHAARNSLEDLHRLNKDRLIAVVLSDAPIGIADGEYLDEQRLLPGETGAIDSVAALRFLDEHGFDGPISVAVHPLAISGLRRDALIKAASDRLDRVWKAAGLDVARKASRVMTKTNV